LVHGFPTFAADKAFQVLFCSVHIFMRKTTRFGQNRYPSNNNVRFMHQTQNADRGCLYSGLCQRLLLVLRKCTKLLVHGDLVAKRIANALAGGRAKEKRPKSLADWALHLPHHPHPQSFRQVELVPSARHPTCRMQLTAMQRKKRIRGINPAARLQCLS